MSDTRVHRWDIHGKDGLFPGWVISRLGLKDRGFRNIPDQKVNILEKLLFYTFCSNPLSQPPNLTVSDGNLTVSRVMKRLVLVRNSRFRPACALV